MYNQRKVKVVKKPLFQGDSGVETFEFEFDKFYNELDLSKLSAYIKLTYPDDSGDVIKLTQKPNTDENKLLLSWTVDGKNTQVAGVCDAQILFENEGGTVVLNSEVFNIEIKNSINSTMLSLGGSSQVEILVKRANEKIDQANQKIDKMNELIDGANQKIDEMDELLNSKIVSSVNGLSGDIDITPNSIGAPTKNELNIEIDKVKNGNYTSKKAECDADGNVISQTYFKKSDSLSKEWNQILSSAYPNNSLMDINLGGEYKEVFIFAEFPYNTALTNVDIRTRVETKIGTNFYPICDSQNSDLSLYSGTCHMSFRIEMCGIYAKVDKQVAYFNIGDSTAIDAYSNVGKNLGQTSINNIRLSFLDANGNFVYPQNTLISVYAR